jgi:single-strand selective monofunctional uracil DNA glycosylase
VVSVARDDSTLVKISRDLSREVSRLRFGPPVEYVYNPLEYARIPHEAYLERYGNAPKKVLFVGMNPGPFGMAQTGVPFGDVALVRDFLGIRGAVERPTREHPKRPVLGFDCARSEVSGTRLWGFARDRFKTPGAFFRVFFVANYCPLAFVERSGTNFTPALAPFDGVIGTVLHPSPASPKANRGWAELAEAELRAYGVELP